MAGITIYEFDTLSAGDGPHQVPPRVFNWLQNSALSTAKGRPHWLRMAKAQGQLAVQLRSYVGVIEAPCGYQIEVLPKLGKNLADGHEQARERLLDMLRCLREFRHLQLDGARLLARKMRVLEVFIGEFLTSVEHVVKHGLRGDYVWTQDNLFVLRGKLQMAAHLRHNLCRADRFFVAFDEFSKNRAENRLLHAALLRVLAWTKLATHRQRARYLHAIFAQVPASVQPKVDFLSLKRDRSTQHYAGALAWAALILEGQSPLTGAGRHQAPSLLFPMEVLFEAYVAKHLRRQLPPSCALKKQSSGRALVRHQSEKWFFLRPDLLISKEGKNRVVLDTKWKLIDSEKDTRKQKYGIREPDFYQLYVYGKCYLEGAGHVVLIYPKTDKFSQPLSVFEFEKHNNGAPCLRLWVLPFCLESKQLIVPSCNSLGEWLESSKMVCLN